MPKFGLAAMAMLAIAALPACSEADRKQIKQQADQVIEEAGQAAEQVIHQADEAVDQMDDMADKVMASGSRESLVATATLLPVAGSGAYGKITFSKVIDGLQVRAEISNLSLGEHAVHIHRHGDCGHDAAAAGPQLKLSTDRAGSILGNLGEFTIAESGSDTELTVLHVPVAEILGKAVVVHADGNDPEQPPDGDAGARIACGVIHPAAEESKNPAGS